MTNCSRFSRKQLYELVWKEPITKIAPRYGISNVGLAKICDRHEIPRPPVGYWAMVAHGHELEIPPLREIDQEDEIEIQQFRANFETAQAKSKVDWDKPFIEVGERLDKPHFFIKRLKSSLSLAKPNHKGLLSMPECEGLRASISKASIPRAMRVLDAIVKHWEATGGTVDSRSGSLCKDGEQISVTLSEKVKRHATRRSDDIWSTVDYTYERTGKLTLEINEWGEGLRKRWSDGKKQSLEVSLGNFALGLDRWVAYIKQRRIDNECEERQRRKATERMNRATERAKEEEQEREKLMSFVSAWEQAERIRGYLRALKVKLDDGSVTPADPVSFQEWFQRAQWYADMICPITPTPERENEVDEPECVAFDQLDLTSRTRAVLHSFGVANSDDLLRLSREQIRNSGVAREWLVWAEINRVLEGLGHEPLEKPLW